MSEGCGKIPNPSKSSPGGLWKRQSFGVIFSEFWYFSFKKSGKIQKNSKNSKKNKNEASAMYCLIYIFFSDFIVDVLIFKKKFHRASFHCFGGAPNLHFPHLHWAQIYKTPNADEGETDISG